MYNNSSTDNNLTHDHTESPVVITQGANSDSNPLNSTGGVTGMVPQKNPSSSSSAHFSTTLGATPVIVTNPLSHPGIGATNAVVTS